MPAVDHRRATAERNTAAILDAAEQLLAEGPSLTMAAIASRAGVSRVTLYAHFASLPELVEAVIERAIAASMAAIDAARPGDGPAGEALARVSAASWAQLAHQDTVARAAAEHVPPDRLRRLHQPLMTLVGDLVARGQRDGALRTDLPADWLVSMFYALLHAAADHARAHGADRARVGEMLAVTLRDVFGA